METGVINGLMVDNMMANGIMGRCKGLGHLYGRMEESMREAS